MWSWEKSYFNLSKQSLITSNGHSVVLQVCSSADGAPWAVCDEGAPCGGGACGAERSGLPGLTWGRKQHGWEMLPLTLPQQRPPGSAFWRSAYSPRHQRGALDGTTHTHPPIDIQGSRGHSREVMVKWQTYCHIPIDQFSIITIHLNNILLSGCL